MRNVRYLREGEGWFRREADVADCGGGRAIGDLGAASFGLSLAHSSGSPALRRPSTNSSKSSGFLYGITLRRCSIE